MDKCSGVTAIVEYDYAAKESDELDLVKGALIHSIKQMPGGWWEGTLQANGKVGMFPDNFVRVIDTNDESTVQLRNKAETLNRRCKVIFSYTQVNDDELSLAVGDVIEFLGEVEEGWWRGRLKNKVGVFPSNFVVAIEPSPVFASKRPPTIHATTTPLGGSLGGVTANKSAAAPTAATTTTVNSANASSASAAAVSTTTTTTSAASSVSQTTKKLNRLSMHNSKTDLLNATTTADGDDAPSLPPKPQREYCRVDFPYAPQNEDELELKVGDIIAIVSMELPDKGWWKGELRGKVGVFPDNFVKLLAPNQVAPLNDTQPTNRTAKTNVVTASSSTTGNATVSGSTALSGNTNSTTTTTTHLTANQSSSATATTKVFIKKSGSTASSNSNRKDSFGSRDSLNDILSETGLPSGNVAAQRKSLENKNFDLTNPPDASTRMGMKKTSIGGSEGKSSTTTTINNNNNSTNDVRKSLENLDEKSLKTTPPPVLTKKPLVPNKKTTTVTSVAGNLLSGLKQKVKGVDNKLTTTVSHDAADGMGSSKMSPSGLPDAGGQPGAVVMRRAATIAVEDSDFDRVERASILSDMRANRVKAPKRRPPSAAINAIGETNNNNSIYLNGSGGGDVGNDDSKPQSSDDNLMGEDGQLAKPKPREWEKKKAPWMEELKASQVKKKTSPGVETTISVPGGSVAERTSKLFADEMKAAASSQSFTTSSSTTSSIAASNLLNSTTKVQSSTISSSSVMQQSMHVESSSSVTTATGSQSLSAKSDLMSKSLSGGAALAGHQLVDDARSTRPNSLALRKNSGASPSTARSSSLKGNNEQATNNTTTTNSSSSNSNGHHPHSVAAKTSSATTATSLSTTTTMLNNHHSSELLTNAKVALNADSTSNNGHIMTSSGGGSVSNATGALRVIELEKRVDRLESVVQTQQRTIEDLVRTLREEKECVKLLRGELDKYAQCVTQV